MSILNVNTIQPVGSGQTITVSATNISAPSTVVTASSFVGNVTGNVTGNLSGGVLSGISTIGVTTVYASGSLQSNSIVPVGGIPAGASGGGIIQIVAATLTPSSSSSLVSETSPMLSTDGAQVGSVSITPRSTSNKILVIVSTQCAGGNNSTAIYAVFRGTSNIAERVYFTGQTTNNGSIPFFIYHLDSPATTSSVTYSFRVGTNNTSYAQYAGRSYTSSPNFYFTETQGQIIVMEVSG